MEDAADLYTKSAHAFKMAKKYTCELYYSDYQFKSEKLNLRANSKGVCSTSGSHDAIYSHTFSSWQ